MALIGCFVTPHPPIIVPEVGGASLAEADVTVRAMSMVREKTALLDPDTIVLMSPHSSLARGQMGVSLASAYKGSLAFFRAPRVRLEAAGDQELAEAIMEQALGHGVPTIITGSHGEVVDLDHGAMVPLTYLMGALTRPCRLVLLAFSYLDLEEHVRFGEAVGQALLAAQQRVLYVASGDLSHRLLPDAPAGYDPRGAQFDKAVADTFAAGDWAALLSIDSGLVTAAGECGYRSLAVLSGIVAALEAAGGQARNHLLSYEGPFGVGYLVGEVEIVEGRSDPLVGLARRAIEAYVGDRSVIKPARLPGVEPRQAGVFVSLHLPGGSLRGCIGTTQPTRASIEEEIVGNAISAASRDPRFYPLTQGELADLDISVDVLGPPEEVSGLQDLDPKEYGIIVRTADGRQALLLPDLEGVDTAEQQLRITCRKGSIDPDIDRYRLFRFRVERHH
jgi:AmmeMemoRadiSam system protein A